MKLQKVKIHDIKPYWNNPRVNIDAIPRVKESIEKFGYNVPITVDTDMVIVTGHTRYAALVQLGREVIEVVVLKDLTKKQAKAYRIADNKTQEFASWDNDALMKELKELDTEDIQFLFDTDLTALLDTDINATYTPVTNRNVSEAKGRLEGAFENKGNGEGFLELRCPHCGEVFSMTKDNIQNELKKL